MEFATSALSTLLPKLAQLLQDEYNLQKSVRKNIQFLSSELVAMHAALENVGQVPTEEVDSLQKIWAQNVRDLSYDMEDIVDTFMVRAEGPDPPSKRSVKKFFKKMIGKVTKITTRHEIAKEINDIKERIMEVAERRDRYILNVITPPPKASFDPRITSLYTNISELVGIRDAMEEVKLMFTEGDDEQHKKRRTVSIAGFGGLGKTTLAKAVYDEIKGEFDCTAFVSVSRNPDTLKLLKDLLYELDKEKLEKIPDENLDVPKLIKLVREFLENKRYLVVIDDIWDKEPWKIIECALIENNMRSIIITTTRIVDVAKHIGGYYRLKPLSDESSKILFYGRVFGSADKCSGNFCQVSERILQKCGGVPLAIITISSLLANKSENIKEWYNVCKSIGSGLLGTNPDLKDMKKILLLSYYDLPSHLKTCLLYLSMFPEDYEIKKDQLIWRWVAEGFVKQKQGDQTFLEIGESYFNELLNRSLIQPAWMDEEGTPKACRVHDTVLDLMISMSKEECFIGTVSGDEKHSLDSKVRRISLLEYTTWPAMMDMPKLRSLAIFKHDAVVIYSMPSLSCYHLLRVLDLQGCKLKDLRSLGFVGSLSYLRYLCLSWSNVTGSRCTADRRLPEEIGKLRFLQTLDLSETMVAELPSSIIGLRQLMCLRGGDNGWRVGPTMIIPDGLKNLTSLEVLERATVKSKCIAEELGYLTQLKVLEFGINKELLEDGQSNKGEEQGLRTCMKALVASVGKLKRLESLKITTNSYFDRYVYLDGSMDEPLGNLQRLYINAATVLPSWIKAASLPILSYLDIWVEKERREDIQVLGTLPCLRHLKFKVMSVPTQALERCVVGPAGFPCAVSCEFEYFGRCNKGSTVPSTFQQGAMPNLQYLKFYISLEDFCISTGGGVGLFSVEDDLGLAHLPSLQTVIAVLSETTKASQEVVKRVNEKLEHEAAVHPNNPTIHLRNW